MTQALLFDSAPEPVVSIPGFPCAWSPDKLYRYALWRLWSNIAAPRYVLWVMLNPSTADETQDDPTIRRCVQFSKDWGYDGLCVCNLFAFRATDPADMKAAADPVGDDNDYWIARVSTDAALIVAAWGEHGIWQNRERAVRLLLPNLHFLSLNKSGQPAHPLYLGGKLTPKPFKLEPRLDNHPGAS